MNQCPKCGVHHPSKWTLVIHKIRGCDFVVPMPQD